MALPPKVIRKQVSKQMVINIAGYRILIKRNKPPPQHCVVVTKQYHKCKELFIPRLRFNRVVREIAQEFINRGIKFKEKAVLILQEATEEYLVSLFQDVNLCANHAKRVTIMLRDMEEILKSGLTGIPVRRRPFGVIDGRTGQS